MNEQKDSLIRKKCAIHNQNKCWVIIISIHLAIIQLLPIARIQTVCYWWVTTDYVDCKWYNYNYIGWNGSLSAFNNLLPYLFWIPMKNISSGVILYNNNIFLFYFPCQFVLLFGDAYIYYSDDELSWKKFKYKNRSRCSTDRFRLTIFD